MPNDPTFRMPKCCRSSRSLGPAVVLNGSRFTCATCTQSWVLRDSTWHAIGSVEGIGSVEIDPRDQCNWVDPPTNREQVNHPMTKSEELSHGILSKVADDEPIFILRAQDILAPEIVMVWVRLALKSGVNTEKCAEALRLAGKMIEWQGGAASQPSRAKKPD